MEDREKRKIETLPPSPKATEDRERLKREILEELVLCAHIIW